MALTVSVLGSSTSMPDCKMGAVIIKIINSTSTTSTKGVMLMSDKELPARVSWFGLGMAGPPDYELNFSARVTNSMAKLSIRVAKRRVWWRK